MIGQTIGHYHILEELGRGGMGVVYKAEDTRLKRDVAIKFLPQHRGHSEDEIKRFKREAQAAAVLNHPNIATIYAIEETSNDRGEVFIAMEYIDGQTLNEAADHYRHDLEATVRIALQTAEGLQAAHEKGVVHRDVKSVNVMLTQQGQVKIMDFGLAKVSHSTILTSSGTTLGTMAYMSPEQIRGDTMDERTDIWSFGVVLYEMLCGELPFQGDMDPAIMYSIMNQPPAPYLSQNEDIPEALKEIVFKALEKDPQARYASAGEMIRDLRQFAPASDPAVPPPATAAQTALQPSKSKRVFWGAGALALLALFMTFFLPKTDTPSTSDPIALTSKVIRDAEARRSIAVLGFKNVSGREDVAWLSTALSEMLTTELAAGEALRTIPGEAVSQMKMELALQEAESFGKQTLEKIYKNLGTDMVVSGSFVVLGDEGGMQIRVDIRIQDTKAGETLTQLAETGAGSELFEIVSRSGMQLRRKLGIEELSAPQRFAVLASRPANTEAVRFYAKGLEKMRRFEALAAKNLFEKAVAADPDFALAYAELATAWKKLGYDKNAQASIEKAREDAESLPREERMIIEGQYYSLRGERAKAAGIYKQLWEEFPDHAEYGLRLADLQSGIGKQQEALSTIDALKQLPEPISSDARIDIMEARISERMTDFERQQQACARARLKATEQGALLLVADSWFFEGRSQYFLNAPQQALVSFDEAKRIYEQTHYRTQVATLLNAIAILERNRGNYPKALRNYNEALRIKREVGEKGGIAMILNGLGIFYGNIGDAEKSVETLRESLKIHKELGNTLSVPGTLINLAASLGKIGRLDSAKSVYEEAVEITLEVNNKSMHAVALNNYSALLNDLGELDEALEKRKTALRIYREIGHKFMISFALFGYGEILKDKGELAAAKAKHDSSLAIRDALKMGQVVQSNAAIASILLEMGKPDEAEEMLEKSFRENAAKMTAPARAASFAVLSAAQAAQNKFSAAKASADSALTLIAGATNTKDRLEVETQAASALLTHASDFDKLKKMLKKALADARGLGFIPHQFNARLTLARLEFAQGNDIAGIEMLKQLYADASKSGFHLIARKAARILLSHTANSG